MKRLGFAGAIALAFLVTGCGGGGGGQTMPQQQPGAGFTNNAAVPAALKIADWGQNAMTGAAYVGAVSNAHLSVLVQVHQQNALGLVQYAQMANDPSSPDYRKWLTPQEIGQRYGASQADYQTVANYFISNGLSVAGWPQHLMLVVSGDQTHMERAFDTTFGYYQRDGNKFVGPRSAPYFQTKLPVDSIGGIAAYRPSHTYMIPSGPRAGAGYTTGFSPSTVRAAFDYIGAYNAGYDGAGVTIGIIGTGAINTRSAAPGDVDLATYATDTNTAGQVATVTEKLVTTNGVTSGLSKSGIAQSAFPYSGNFTATPAPPWGAQNEDGESQLDTQQAATLAPASSVDFYLAYNASDCTGVTFPNSCPSGTGSAMWGISESDPEIQEVIALNTSDVISMSFGEGETQTFSCYSGCSNPYQGSYSQLEFAALASEGIAAFASSGDSGSAECYNASNTAYLPQQCVSYPASDPNVTSVGGITANVDLTGAITAPWLAWGISTSDTGYGGQQGSGGGPSAFIPAPSWQQSALGATLREQPDVSLDGDPSTGVSFVENGSISGIGGTSVSAPEMAAMWADVLSACKLHPGAGACPATGTGNYWRLGNASPYFYAIYKHTPYTNASTTWTPTLAYTNVFYDIVYGDNQMDSNPGSATPVPGVPVAGFAAGPGYDEVTGVGVPFALHLINAILGP